VSDGIRIQNHEKDEIDAPGSARYSESLSSAVILLLGLGSNVAFKRSVRDAICKMLDGKEQPAGERF
jgi:hypothetical protein